MFISQEEAMAAIEMGNDAADWGQGRRGALMLLAGLGPWMRRDTRGRTADLAMAALDEEEAPFHPLIGHHIIKAVDPFRFVHLFFCVQSHHIIIMSGTG
jgi:hypothetical protein